MVLVTAMVVLIVIVVMVMVVAVTCCHQRRHADQWSSSSIGGGRWIRDLGYWSSVVVVGSRSSVIVFLSSLIRVQSIVYLSAMVNAQPHAGAKDRHKMPFHHDFSGN